MSTNSKVNRTTHQAADQKLIDGLKKHEATIPSLVIGGTSLKTTDIIGYPASTHRRRAMRRLRPRLLGSPA
jgi:hypothetical protein